MPRSGTSCPIWRSRSSAPPTRPMRCKTRMHEYFETGVKQVWVVYTKRSEIYVYSSPKQIQVLQLGDELDGGDLLPGFRLPLAAIFEDEPEAE